MSGESLYERLTKLSPERLALLALEQQERLEAMEGGPTNDPIAVVGLGCRFPGAPDPDAYWAMLRDGVDAVGEVTPDRWDIDQYYDPDPDVPGHMATRWAGLVDDVDRFDPQFFGISPREARAMDPQQRLLLEVAWHALEHAGIPPDSLAGSSTGTYIGACNADYAQMLFGGDGRDLDMYLATGNADSVASGRLSYVLGFQGPALSVDTACSSSLVATHLAVQGLRTRDCDLALAGGVNVILSAKTTIALSQAKMMAADGRCKAFDAAADGFVRGEGCGILVLKRLPDAERDGDRILAVIRGSAVNQDGRSNGLTAPNGPSQAAVIRAALADGSVEPTEVGYVEAHGTGTSLGDPIEIQAMGTALGADRGAADRLLVGSVKTNIGHLESAAGVAGLIKLVLAMEHGQVPASLHLKEPNPFIPWDRLPIDVATEPQPWPRAGRALAGVSSFGFSGTNAHIIVEPAPGPATGDRDPGPDSDRPVRSRHLLAISAADPETLDSLAERYADSLRTGQGSLPDLARMAATARSHHGHRLAVVASDAAEAVEALTATGDREAPGARSGARRPKVAFLFTGHGSQYQDMGAGLHAEQAVFRDAFDRCVDLLATDTGLDLRQVFGQSGADGASPLDTMTLAQPAVFAVEYAMAQLWRSWGITPDVVVGHSVGEYVAAVDAGVMSLADGLRLVATRGRLMDTLPPGAAMATILASEAQVAAIVGQAAPQVSVAAVNGPTSVAVSGSPADVEAVLAAARAGGIEVRPLDIPVAAHSPQVEPILDEFERVAATVTYHQPSTTVVSGLTGGAATGDDLVTAGYWRRHLRQPVRFADAFAAVHHLGARVFIETGPHPTLINMGRHIVDETPDLDPTDLVWLPSLRRGRHDLDVVLGSLGQFYTAGGSIDWPAVAGDRSPVVTGPAYPFRRDRHWAAPPAAVEGRRSDHPLVGSRLRSPALAHPVFEAEVAASWPEWFDDHRIHGVAIAPAPALIEMMLGAAEAAGQPADALAGLDVVAPLTLPDDGATTVQVLIRPGQQATVEVVSHDAGVDRWVTHATANLFPATDDHPANAVDRLDRSELVELDGAEFYRHLASAGLGFGPAFQGISAVWTGPARAVARVEPSDAVTADGSIYGIHPAMLDACFHAVGAPDEVRNGGEVALLVGIEHLVRRQPVTGPVWVEVTLRNGADHPDDGSIVADLTVLDDDARPLVEATGVHLRLADRQSLRLASGRHLDDLVHEVIWEPIQLGGRAGDLEAALDRVAESAKGAVTADEIADYRLLADDLDRLAEAHVGVAIDQLDGQAVIERYRPLHANLLAANGDRDDPAPDPESVASALRARHPEHGIEIDLVDRCGRGLAAVMTGQAEPLDLLFPGGDQRSAEHLYRDTPVAKAANGLVADAVVALSADRPVRILEVGAGTGATTDAVLDALAPGTAAYTMTDVAPTFVARAAERYAGRSEVECRVLDIERDPGTQGFALGGHDLVIAANVVHATSDVAATVDNLRRLLAPGGHLLLLEATSPQLWVTTTFGLTEGWWRFSDHGRRPDGPLLPADRWLQVLGEAGLIEARTLTGQPGGPSADRGPDLAGQAVITARTPERSDPTTDLVVGRPSPWRQGLVDAMVDRAEPGSTVATLDEMPDAAALTERLTTGPAVGRVVVLTDGIDTAAPGPTDPEVAQAEALAASTAVLHAAKAVASAGTDTTIFAVTRGTQPAGDAVVSQPHLAAVWGLGRVVSLELPDAWGATIDLGPEGAPDEAAMVASLIARSGNEDQFALRGSEVLVPRLAPAADPPPPATPAVRSDATYLITGGLGGLGLVVADWLADHGATNLILLGRRGLPDPEAVADDDGEGQHRLAAVRALLDRGVRVEVAAVDLRDRQALAAVVDRCGSDLPPLRGVIHTAAALGERALADLDVEDLDTMLHPKVAGTWALDAVTADAPLDIAVSFSSTTALLGSAGLGHYAAANAVLDAHALGHRGRPDGRPWVSVNWGTWDVMRAATDEERATVGRGGLRPIPSSEALDQLGRIMAAAAPAQVVVVDADWQVLRPLYEARRPRPFLSLLGLSTGDVGDPAQGRAAADVAAELAAADPAMRPSMLEAFLRAEVAKALELNDPARVDIHQGLFEMGMDSLMSVELKGHIERGLGLSLPSTLTFNHPTVAELTEHLLSLLSIDADDRSTRAEPVEPVGSGPVEAQGSTEDDGSDRPDPDDLDEAELEARLAQRLATLRGTPEGQA